MLFLDFLESVVFVIFYFVIPDLHLGGILFVPGFFDFNQCLVVVQILLDFSVLLLPIFEPVVEGLCFFLVVKDFTGILPVRVS